MNKVGALATVCLVLWFPRNYHIRSASPMIFAMGYYLLFASPVNVLILTAESGKAKL